MFFFDVMLAIFWGLDRKITADISLDSEVEPEITASESYNKVKGGIMRKEIKLWCVLGLVGFICIALTSGCTLAKIHGRGATPVMLNNPPQKVEVIKHFAVSKGITFDFTSSFDASEMLADVLQETRCDAIINVGLEVKTTVGDFFLNLITLGIANAKHLVVVGDAVRFPDGNSLDSENIEILAESDNIKDLTSMLMRMSKDEQSKYIIVKYDNGYRLVCPNEK